MKEILNYLYYRIAKAYKIVDENDYLNWGYWILLVSFAFIALSATVIITSALGLVFNIKIIIIVFIPFGVLGFIWGFLTNKRIKQERYNRLEKRYKDERHSSLKGCVILLYFVSTIAMYVISLAIFGD